jgi:predicted RNA polymerase sigma factor
MADGPSAGLALLDDLDDRMAGHYRVDVVRAHLLEMSGDTVGAREHYGRAARRTTNLPERDYLSMRAARLNQQP